MQPGLFFFPLYHTNKAVKDFNVLVTLTVYDGAFSDLDVVNQFLNDFPVKFLHIQIAADDVCPLPNIFNLLLGFSFLCQKNFQTLRLLYAFLFTFLNQDRKGIVTPSCFGAVCGAFVGCMPVFPCRGYSGMAAAFSVALAAFCSKTARTAARSKSSPSFRAVMGFVLSGVR